MLSSKFTEIEQISAPKNTSNNTETEHEQEKHKIFTQLVLVICQKEVLKSSKLFPRYSKIVTGL